MKSHLFIGILLLICAQCAHSASIPLKREAVMSPQEEVAHLNMLRLLFSQKGEIANMREMVYDEGYRKRLLQSTCDHLPKGDFIVVQKPTDDKGAQLQQMMQLAETKIKEAPPQIQKSLEKYKIALLKTYFNPVKYRVGCADFPVPCNGMKSACLLGPLSQPFDDEIKEGPPGSECPDRKTGSGLCSSPRGNEKNEVTTKETSMKNRLFSPTSVLAIIGILNSI